MKSAIDLTSRLTNTCSSHCLNNLNNKARLMAGWLAGLTDSWFNGSTDDDSIIDYSALLTTPSIS
jgi:hypothetical protein